MRNLLRWPGRRVLTAGAACPHLGDAQMPQVKSFGPDVYTNR